MIQIWINLGTKASFVNNDPDIDQFDKHAQVMQNDLDMDQNQKKQIMKASRVRTSGELGVQIREERRKKNLTQAELAARAGVSRRFIYQLENGSRDSFPLGKVLQVIRRLNLEIQIVHRVTE